MCGIVGYIGPKDGLPILLEGLQRVEYRGYDSAGVALVVRKGELKVVKKKGKLRELEAALPKKLSGHPAIGHTRWATHGEPSDVNAHPHVSGTVALVHNGIIENASELKMKLEAEGVVFLSETDTEVLVHLVAQHRNAGHDLEDALRLTLALVEGTYGICVIDAAQPDRIVIARNGSPVIIGIGEKEMLVGSDVSAMVRHTKQVVPLDDGEMAVLKADGYRTFQLDATPTQKRVLDVTWNIEQLDKGGFEHFLRKEIHEQPVAIERALRGRLDDRFNTAKLGGVNLSARDLMGIRRVKFLGCGTAYNAGLAGAQMIEALARIPADAESASEFRYRNPVIEPDVLYVAVSQSGETADTLAAVMEIKRKGGQVLAVVNVVGSTIARECDGIYMHAGPEVSVASTKVFTSMLVSFGLLGLHIGRVRDLGPSDGRRIIEGLKALPDAVRTALGVEAQVAAIAEKYKGFSSMFFIGRNTGYPIALEGALKLKEVSYIHAEAYAAAELKHGPIALISETFPTVVVLPDDDLYEKNLSSIQQVRARKGPVIAVSQRPLDPSLADEVIVVPSICEELDPIVLNIPLQLLAYHSAVKLGRDVDQPRNLAKSVTVE
jgi:glutamine---fructose-6-phosphate transaminase (isomerizing)